MRLYVHTRARFPPTPPVAGIPIKFSAFEAMIPMVISSFVQCNADQSWLVSPSIDGSLLSVMKRQQQRQRQAPDCNTVLYP